MLCFLMFRFCCLSVKTVEVCFSRQLIVGIRLIFVLFVLVLGGGAQYMACRILVT